MAILIRQQLLQRHWQSCFQSLAAAAAVTNPLTANAVHVLQGR
jgi:hypothetical protein